jgi:hypothetical protein
MAISLNEYTSRQQGGGASTFRPMSIGEYADPMQSLDAAPSRALLGDIWSGIQSGAVGSAEMALKGLSTLGWDEADTLLQDIADFRASSTFDDRSTQYAEGGFRKLAVDTFESFTQNMGVRLPAMAVGALAGPVGIAAGFLSGGPLYGLAEYHDFMKDAEAAGVPRDVARSKAIISGIAEGGLELA